jgi:hypothetical protein
MIDIKQITIESLSLIFTNAADRKGYVSSIDANLLPGIDLVQFVDDIRDGDGNELDSKFMAVHSSSALAVNCFAWFNKPDRLSHIALLDNNGARSFRFERKFPIFAKGKAPNIDIVVDRDSELIVIESKLTEHLSKTKPKLSASYDRLAPPGIAETCWWGVYQQAKTSKSQYLDIAQLLKHYFGLRTHQLTLEIKKPIRFLYLFWEPLNAADIEVFRQHRRECEILAQATATSEIPFLWMSYLDLWKQWLNIPAVEQHARNLMNRYAVTIPCIPDCIRCGKPLSQRILHVVPGKCWKCGTDMPIAFMDCDGIALSPEDMTDEEVKKAQELGAQLTNKFSQTRSEQYCANTCPNCNAMTGSHYLHDFWYEADGESGIPMGLSCLNSDQDPDSADNDEV